MSRNGLPSAGAGLAAQAHGPRGPHLESVILEAGQSFLAHANELLFPPGLQGGHHLRALLGLGKGIPSGQTN